MTSASPSPSPSTRLDKMNAHFRSLIATKPGLAESDRARYKDSPDDLHLGDVIRYLMDVVEATAREMNDDLLLTIVNKVTNESGFRRGFSWVKGDKQYMPEWNVFNGMHSERRHDPETVFIAESFVLKIIQDPDMGVLETLDWIDMVCGHDTDYKLYSNAPVGSWHRVISVARQSYLLQREIHSAVLGNEAWVPAHGFEIKDPDAFEAGYHNDAWWAHTEGYRAYQRQRLADFLEVEKRELALVAAAEARVAAAKAEAESVKRAKMSVE